MNILFVLSHELYLRNFSGVIQRLADRGHTINLAFTKLRDAQDPAIEEIISWSTNINLIDCPVRNDWWWPVVDVLRLIRDYMHSLNPAFANAPKMRERAGRRVPRMLRWLILLTGRIPAGRSAVIGLLDWIEWSIPCDEDIISWLKARKPDVVLVSPLIDMNYHQMEVLKAARHSALVSACLVASWDNLTMKGQIQIIPDKLVVWNKAQVEEAVILHGVNSKNIIATGAQLYDQWFEMSTNQSRKEFCEMVGGLDPAKPIILYTGSSPFICPNEQGFFEQWYRRLRADPDPAVRSANVLIRPHPLHAAQWSRLDLAEKQVGRVLIWPRHGEMPISMDQKQSYFNCLWHSNAVVGINTSVFLEAGILGRSTFTFRNDFFEESQQGTLHFSYIAESGILKIAGDLNEHMGDLSQELGKPQDAPRVQVPFVEEFLRPNGLKNPALGQVVAAIEQLEALRTSPRYYSPLAVFCRILIWPLAAFGIRPKYLARTKNRPAVFYDAQPKG